MAFIAEVRVGGALYLAVKSSDGRQVLRWLGRFDALTVRDLRKAIRDFKIDLSARRRRRERRAQG